MTSSGAEEAVFFSASVNYEQRNPSELNQKLKSTLWLSEKKVKVDERWTMNFYFAPKTRMFTHAERSQGDGEGCETTS